MDEKILEKVKSICVTTNVKPIVLLETPRAKQEVDNGMGVDFELPQYSLIYKRLK